MKKLESHKRKMQRRVIGIGGTILLVCLAVCIFKLLSLDTIVQGADQSLTSSIVPIKVEYLTVNENSRPGTKLNKVKGIVIHYVGNPGSTAENNRNYFQNLAYDHSNSASAHFVVGLEGEVVQCIPLNEQAYATRTRNTDTIGIEVCHPDESGKFSDVTYDSVVKLAAELLKKYHLTKKNLMRHYDVTGKLCPKYYVEHEDAWKKLVDDIGEELDRL